MKVSIICDNTAIIGSFVKGEDGFSALLEIESLQILFDTGFTGIFVDNAERMGLSVNPDILLLSHGHRDHTGGLLRFITLPLSPGCTSIVHPDLFLAKWKLGNEFGIPISAQSLRQYLKISYAKGPVWITDSILYTGEIPRYFSFEPAEDGRTKVKDGCIVPDLLEDESALVCRSASGLVIITGCAHRGICNTIRYAQQLCNEKEIEAVIGGLHLASASEERIESTIQFLQKTGVHHLYPCHCTGFATTLAFARELPVQYCGCGTVLSFDTRV